MTINAAPSEPRASVVAAPFAKGGKRDVFLFFALACGITWLMDLPLAWAWMQRVAPADYALNLTGLGALGPTVAALVVAARRHEIRGVFGRWRTPPLWIGVGLIAVAALHVPATVIEVLLGGTPAQWFYLPVRPEHVAALILFSVGEEFGWRGFAYPRLATWMGPVRGCIVLGAVWAVWHLGMLVSPDTGHFEWVKLGVLLIELPLWSLVFAWVFERAHRSMAVAIALHAGAHLDNVYRAPETEVRLRILRLLVLLVAAVFAARQLSRSAQRVASAR